MIDVRIYMMTLLCASASRHRSRAFKSFSPKICLVVRCNSLARAYPRSLISRFRHLRISLIMTQPCWQSWHECEASETKDSRPYSPPSCACGCTSFRFLLSHLGVLSVVRLLINWCDLSRSAPDYSLCLI